MAFPKKHTNTAGVILRWFVVEEPRAILQGYLRYARAVLEIIPFAFLTFTLFAPWKNIIKRPEGHGININRLMERIVLSALSRCVGAIMRVAAMLLGALIHIVLFLSCALYLLLWVTFPILAITHIVFTLSLPL